MTSGKRGKYESGRKLREKREDSMMRGQAAFGIVATSDWNVSTATDSKTPLAVLIAGDSYGRGVRGQSPR